MGPHRPAAGAVIIGKANLTEGVFGKYVPPFNEPLNPWSLEHWGGVSSGGSGVAVAAGLGYGSISSDTGGSIRMPSAVNGVTGLKPTWGRISRHGAFELAGLLDHVGHNCPQCRRRRPYPPGRCRCGHT